MRTEVFNIVSDQSGVPIEKLNGTTLIEEDLSVTGDDAWDVIEALNEKFDIDLKEFDFLKHFGPEAGWATSEEYGYYPVSIDHLIKVVENKKWFLPERNENNYKKLKQLRKLNRIKMLLLVSIIFTIFWLLK